MINLKPKHANKLRKIFEEYCPNAEIWAYGSRVDGDSHDGSDLDLTVIDFYDPQKNIGELKQIFTDSDIPFLIDICEFRQLPPSFQSKIKQKYTVLYNRFSRDI